MTVRQLDQISDDDASIVGGKAVALARMARAGLKIPSTLCLAADAYRRFVDNNGLAATVILELGRKRFADMRWEELWDASLRIRNRFLRAPLPKADRMRIEAAVRGVLGDRLLVVRSSAPGEDSESVSFAGLHDSYVGVRTADVAEHVRRVWASLWSDRALLYRQELGLDPVTSAMAVVIQEIVEGDVSGVAFGVDPTDSGRAVIEAVYGLNQGLVDGSVEPDRWFLARDSSKVLSHRPPPLRQRMMFDQGELRIRSVRENSPPLGTEDLRTVQRALDRVEALFGTPQDMEWTLVGDRLTVLQARPVTTAAAEGDQRAWYLSLTRSLSNLQQLRHEVEEQLLPAMDREARELEAIDLTTFDDTELADEISRRKVTHDRWVDVYWQEFIPLAHGVRLFGQYYNEVLRPADPYQFMELLTATPMLSLQRNRAMEQMADRLRENPELASRLASGGSGDPQLEAELEAFMKRFGSATVGGQRPFAERKRLLEFLSVLASRPPAQEVERPSLEGFLEQVPDDEQETARNLLEVARVSHRLRDDDNIHIAAIKSQVLRAVDEGRRRIGTGAGRLAVDQVVSSLRNPNTVIAPDPEAPPESIETGFDLRPRQLVGQPAGPGVARGRARVVSEPEDLFAFVDGDVLVCDAVEPNMTFVVPLAAAVVERRGGMLIHGAIIAREYGLPCVTGVPRLTTEVITGTPLTVDGYLGIVTVGQDSPAGDQPM